LERVFTRAVMILKISRVLTWTQDIRQPADSYLKLIEAIDRPMFGVHLDPVNLINCPARYYGNAELLRECFSKLGPWIVSCHGKDILMRHQLTVHLDEVRPGLGALDYKVFLQELSRLPRDVPLILEHLEPDEYPLAREYVVGVAAEIGLTFHTSLSPQILASFCLETSGPGSHARHPAAWEPPLLGFPDKN
jgi:sugar phosphate isomerase/epimerase